VLLGLAFALPLGVHAVVGRRQQARQHAEAAPRHEQLRRPRATPGVVHPTPSPLDAGARHRLH